jgi:lysophospholipase L1-like esterase
MRRTSCAVVTGLVAAALLTGTCGSPSLPSRTIVIPPPAVTCPVAPAPVMTSNGQSAVVSYGPPAVTGGTAPVSASCTPPTGSTFALGSTAVTCTAADAVQRTASCSFTVIVALPALRLSVTRILAFGDSITEGEVPMVGEPLSASNPEGLPRFRALPHVIEPAQSYPADLVTLLAQRYTVQGASRIDAFTLAGGTTVNCMNDPPPPATAGILVINAGCQGEHAGGSTTVARLAATLATYHPDLVLLLEGVNDLGTGASIPATVHSVLTLIAQAENSGARVMVGTLLPEIQGGLNAGAVDLIVPFNAQLRPAAMSVGAQVVDLYSDIDLDVADWISPLDGLHPTAAGYQEMARVWFNSVRSAFEVPPSPTATTRHPASPSTIGRGGSRR